MAEVRPLHALHYNLAAVPSLSAVTAPPYDVIDAARRRELLARSPLNMVEIDLPQAPQGGDPYAHAAETLEAWTLEGVLVADREPAIWALEQDYVGPDGSWRSRRGLLARIRITEYGPGLIRPHERTQPGPKEDRLRLTEATRCNLSPIFALHPGDAWRHLQPALGPKPWGEARDDDGTAHRTWRVTDPAVHEAIAAELAGAELLIADGHHRYETARAHAEGIGGEGAHRYTLACLVSLDDPGLTVFATHRLLHNLDASLREAIRDALLEAFELTEVEEAEIVPGEDAGEVAFGYIDAHHRQAYRLVLTDPGALDRALEGHAEPYRRLDAAALEALILRGALGMSTDEIAARRGLSYCSDTGEAVRRVTSGEADAAFLLRPTPVDQVRAVAEAGETMPPKSTYFFPKLPTGIVLNPLS